MVEHNVILESSDCPLHSGGEDIHILRGRDRLHDLPGEFDIVECKRCGLMRTSPRPVPNSIGYYYPLDYGPYKGTVVATNNEKRNWKSLLVSVGKTVFDVKAAALPKMPVGEMLEIGCASGSFLHLMAKRGWNVEGIEFSPEAAQSARELGYPVSTGAVETIDKPRDHFDLVVGWMVVEHLHDPIVALQKLAMWTRKGGMLAISVPNAGSFEFRLFGPRWYALHLPNHLYHFDPQTIRATLEAGGWRVTKIIHQRTISNIIASAGYWLSDHGYISAGRMLSNFPERGGRIGTLLLFPISYVMALFGQTGRMTVWAERKD